MNSLPTKLKENHHRRVREGLLSKAPASLSEFLAHLEFSSDSSVIRHAAFPTWSDNEDNWTTTRGKVANWVKCDFSSWPELVSDLHGVPLPYDCRGWLFFDPEGPYFRVGGTEFTEWIGVIADFAAKENGHEFAWVGDDQDCGIIVEFEHTSFCKNDFTYCAWIADAESGPGE